MFSPLAQAPLPHSVASNVAVLPAQTLIPTVWLTSTVLVRTTALAEGQEKAQTPLPPPPVLRAMVVCTRRGEEPPTNTPQSKPCAPPVMRLSATMLLIKTAWLSKPTYSPLPLKSALLATMTFPLRTAGLWARNSPPPSPKLPSGAEMAVLVVMELLPSVAALFSTYSPPPAWAVLPNTRQSFSVAVAVMM